jgi:hypothetical protein
MDQNALQILHYVRIYIANDPIALLFKKASPHRIVHVIGIVSVAVNLDHQFGIIGSEICDVWADHLLPPELDPGKPFCPESEPHAGFRFRHLLAVFASVAGQFGVAQFPLSQPSPLKGRGLFFAALVQLRKPMRLRQMCGKKRDCQTCAKAS